MLGQMHLELRGFEPHDYEALAYIVGANNPAWLSSANDWAGRDAARPHFAKGGRWVVTADGWPAGIAQFDQEDWLEHERQFMIGISVRPDMQRRGIGGWLYHHLTTELSQYHPSRLCLWTNETRQNERHFYGKRGFNEIWRNYASYLNLADFDPSRWYEAWQRPFKDGYEIVTLADLYWDAGFDWKLFETRNLLAADAPTLGHYQADSFESFFNKIFHNPDFIPEAYFVAIKRHDWGIEYVGLSETYRLGGTPDLTIGLTGVKREHRRHGLALSLKLAGIRYALSHGHPTIHTTNAGHNRAILNINESMGFYKHPAELLLALDSK
jgi:mycothiol synthase